jgi:hypothetical protein
MHASVIEKESVAEIRFVNHEVLQNQQEIIKRRHQLQRAVSLGNLYKGKCKITFMSKEGPKAVETTVWAATENYILIKGGIQIPIHSITAVEYC